MANSSSFEQMSSYFSTTIKWVRENVFHTIGLVQIGSIGFTYLLARLIEQKVMQSLEKGTSEAASPSPFVANQDQLSALVRYFFWAVLLWFCRVLFEHLKMPFQLLQMALSLLVVLLVIRYASSHLKSTFWRRLVFAGVLIGMLLRTLQLMNPDVLLYDSMTIGVGKINISIWRLTEGIFVFMLLWAAVSMANRFFAHWLATSTRLNYSDQLLIRGVTRTATRIAVVLIALSAAGIHPTAIAVTGGAIGIAVGVGLQKIGSNLVSGLILLINKPIRQGDVIALEKGFAGASHGWVTRMELMYVRVATRDGIEELVPNEYFLTQKVENLSSSDNLLRLRIPFGISFESDLRKAIALTLEAVKTVDRVLTIPEPHCLLRELGDSTVNLELRVWIQDPKKGVSNVKSAVLLAVWDIFHANGIEFAFPQRDVHIKGPPSLNVSKGVAKPSAEALLGGEEDKVESPV
jgi:small-conductance mechanosensitive channel